VRKLLLTDKTVVYKAFGFRIISDITLPELPQLSIGEKEEVEIKIEMKDLNELWNEYSYQKRAYVIEENLVIFEIPDIAIFSIQDGNNINFSPKQEGIEDIIRIYILGTCMGALLMQRRIYPLHGSAVAIDGKAYAFIGDSGAGKSTLASTFLEKGYQLLSDDVIAVSLSSHLNTPLVTPSYPQQKLWQDSLNQLGLQSRNYRSIYGRENKYCVPVSTQYFTEPLPLAGVFELIKSDITRIQIQKVRKLEILQTLFNHTYRNFLIPGLNLTEWHFITTTTIAESVNVNKLIRPIFGFSAQDLASEIINTIKGE
jgi:hypothetical protein